MGVRAWHIARAEHHQKAASYLSQNEDFLDWAVVALFYAAQHFVHSVLADEPSISKDERHPRKHTGPKGAESGGRGTNQMVKAYLSPVYRPYIDLFESSRRTRYDINQLGGLAAYGRFEELLRVIERYCRMMHMTRPALSTEAP